jgi:hypothetical protein
MLYFSSPRREGVQSLRRVEVFEHAQLDYPEVNCKGSISKILKGPSNGMVPVNAGSG